MLPKIELKFVPKSESIYPKIKMNTSNKENNISQLKKLREFLEEKSIQIDRKEPQKYSQNHPLGDRVEYVNISNIITSELSLQESDRTKANTSEVSRKNKRIPPQLKSVFRWSMQRKQPGHVEKIKLKQIADFCFVKHESVVGTSFSKCKIL